MGYMAIRRIIGTLVIICGIVSGILIYESSLNISTSGLFSNNADASAISLFLKGLACGIFAICLALGAMVFKIGGGKESITLDLKEDKIEASVKYDSSTMANQEINSKHSESKEEKVIKETEAKVYKPKRLLIIVIAAALLLLNLIFFVLISMKKG